MASPGDQEEVYSLLLTDIDKGIVDEAMVKASWRYVCLQLSCLWS